MHKLPHLFLPESMTTTVPMPEPDHCTCDVTQGTWDLEADDSGLSLTHSVCGKSLQTDLMEAVVMDQPFKVTMTPEKDDCHCRYSCDCTVWLTLKEIR